MNRVRNPSIESEILVAASDATAVEKASADYVCDGTADEVQIQAAIDSLPAYPYGGTVRLSSGYFYVSSPVNVRPALRLVGAGMYSTKIFLSEGANPSTGILNYPDQGVNRGGFTLEHLSLCGNKLNAYTDGGSSFTGKFTAFHRITGISGNTDSLGRLYCKIVSTVPGAYTLWFYNSPDRTTAVGFCDFMDTGLWFVEPYNGSGLGGYIGVVTLSGLSDGQTFQLRGNYTGSGIYTHSTCIDAYFHHFTIESCAERGIDLGNGWGCVIEDAWIEWNGSDAIRCRSGSALKIDRVKAITNDGHGINLQSNSLVTISQCELEGSDSRLVDESNTKPLWSTGKAGLYLEGSGLIKVSNCYFAVNQEGAGVAVSPSSASNGVSVIGCQFHRGHATINRQTTGILIPPSNGSSGSAHRWSVSGCNFSQMDRGICIGRHSSYASTNGQHSITGCTFYQTSRTPEVQDSQYAVVYDDSTGVYYQLSSSSSGDFVQWQVWPNNTQANDAFYIGSSRPFDAVTFDRNVAAAYTGSAATWEYWNGSSWAALPVAYDGTGGAYVYGTRPFQTDGTVLFAPPPDWVVLSGHPSLVTAWWIRVRPSTPSAITTIATLSDEHTVVPPCTGILLSSRSNTVSGCIITGSSTYPIALADQQNIVSCSVLSGGYVDLLVSPSAGYSTILSNVLSAASMFAMVLGSGAYNNIVVGNQFRTTAAMSSLGSSSKVIANDGYTVTSSGTAVISATSTSVNVSHGLSITPSLANIAVTPLGDTGSASKIWVSGATSSQFTINVDSPPGSDITVGWHIVSV